MSSGPVHQDEGGAGVRSVAARIRSRRRELGLTLQDVAGRSDVSKSYLSQVETGKLSPSLGTLERISAALRLPTRALVADPGDYPAHGRSSDDRAVDLVDRRVFVTRRGERKQIAYAGGLPLELLTPDLQRQLEVTATSDPAGLWRDVVRHGNDSEEFVFVAEGEYELMLHDDVHRLRQGDSMCFYPESTFRVRAIGPEAGRAIWIALPPVF